MAKGIIGNLRVNMGLDSAQFQAGVAKVNKSMDGLAKKAAVFGAAVGAAMTAAAGAMAVAVGNVINRADQLGDVADRLGVSITALQELRHAAERSGMGLQNFDVALRRFIRRSSEAALGTGAAKTAFEQLGISLRDAQGNLKPTEDLLNEVADAMQRVPTQADRLRLAFQMFDTDGAAMLNMLQQGSAGMNSLREEARNLGVVLSEETVRGAQAFKDNLEILNKTKDGLIMRLTAHLLPALELLSEKFVELVNDGTRMEVIGESVSAVFNWIAREAAQTTLAFERLRVELQALAHAGAILKEGGILGLLESVPKAWEAFASGQAKSGEMARQLDETLQAMADGMVKSQGSIQRRISAAFGDAGTRSANEFALNFEKATNATGAKIVNPLVAEAARIFEATRTPLETYQAQIARLNQLLQEGYITQDTYNRAVLQAQDAFERAEVAGKKTESVFQQIGQTMSHSFSSAFTSIIDGSQKVGDAIAGLLKQLANLLMNRAFQMLFNAILPGSGGMGLGYFPPVPSFATGTNFAPGGMAWVGERGPELVNLPRGSQVIPNHELGGLGGGVNVDARTTIDARGADPSAIARLEAALRKRDVELPGRVVAEVRRAQKSNVKLA